MSDLPDIPINLHAHNVIDQIPNITLLEAKSLLNKCIIALGLKNLPYQVEADTVINNGYIDYTVPISDEAINMVIEKIKKAGYMAKKIYSNAPIPRPLIIISRH